jgi:hypothetical protein
MKRHGLISLLVLSWACSGTIPLGNGPDGQAGGPGTGMGSGVGTGSGGGGGASGGGTVSMGPDGGSDVSIGGGCPDPAAIVSGAACSVSGVNCSGVSVPTCMGGTTIPDCQCQMGTWVCVTSFPACPEGGADVMIVPDEAGESGADVSVGMETGSTACGPSTSCAPGEVCYVNVVGSGVPDGGSVTTYECQPLPTACHGVLTCLCDGAQCSGTLGMCSASGMTLTCNVPGA